MANDYLMRRCDYLCPEGKHGEECKSECQCQNGGSCSPMTGKCYCMPGWTVREKERESEEGAGETMQLHRIVERESSGDCVPIQMYKLIPCSLKVKSKIYQHSTEWSLHRFQWTFKPLSGHGGFMAFVWNHRSVIDIKSKILICTSKITGVMRLSQGTVCANRCPEGTWSKNCSQSCDCYNRAGCDHITGKCQCKPGYYGDKVSIDRSKRQSLSI